MKLNHTILLAAAICISACNTSGNLDLREEGKGCEATAVIDGDDCTKAYLDEAAFRFLWAWGDAISVVTGTENKKFTLTDGADKTKASFYCPGNVADGGHFAVYPYNPDCVEYSSVLTLTYPEILEYDAAHSSAGPNTMVAYRESGLNFTFFNGCSIIRFALTGAEKLSALEITSIEGKPLCGEALVEFTAGGKPTITMTGKNPKVRVDFGKDGFQLGQTAKNLYVALPPAALKKGVSVLFIGENGHSTLCKTISAAALPRSSILEMTPLEYKSDVFTDLSAKCSKDAGLAVSQTANCYIVDAPGKYKIPCTVKGCTLESVGTPTKAEVLWATTGTATAPAAGALIKSNATVRDGYLLFETPDVLTEGNALIAVKDAKGTILWSWHIWLTSEKMKTYAINGFQMTDRNLGALAAGSNGGVKAFGMFYQWGRKDPFYGSSALSSSVPAACSGTAVTAVTKSAATGTIAYTTAHPTEYINASDANWLYSSDDDLWDVEKTVYDPCPPGYSVPGTAWTTGFTSAMMTWGGNATTGYGRTHTASGFWFPAAGKYSYQSADGALSATINQVGTQGRIWSATPNEGNGSAYGLGFSSSSFSSANAYNRSCAYSIRCAKMD